jgi:hypothetical protein
MGFNVRCIGDKIYGLILYTNLIRHIFRFNVYLASKRYSSPVTGPEWPRGFQELRFPDFVTKVQDGGKVVSFTHRPHLPPGNATGTHFC